jgi:glycyl-tRNA synthetase beta chain
MVLTMADLFLEVRCEEIPAKMLKRGIRDLGTRLFEELMGRNLAPAEVTTGFTPRRLVATLVGLPEREPDREERLTGPPVSVGYTPAGEPTPALLGFAKKCGVAPEDVERVKTEKGEYLAATRFIAGVDTVSALSELLPRVLRDLSWPKSMRWGASEGPWVRPVRSIVALLDGEVIPFELLGVTSGRTTTGHPIHSPQSIEVTDSDGYYRAMEQLDIIISFEKRRELLLERLEEAATEVDGRLVEDQALLDKLTSICGIPGIVRGQIEHMDLPREVLITSLRDHQSAFTVESDGELLPWFLTVMDRGEDPDGRVQRGNEWVVAARLDDARFFYSEDQKTPLDERHEHLDRVTFHDRLGSYADKSDINVALVAVLCEQLGWSEEADDCSSAAALLKCDLTTEMVKEFTSLQGVMGGIYSRHEKHPEAVWKAIYEQYRPISTSDPIPTDRVGQVVSLADRLSTLVGMFGSGLIPTGSKDPFALRRAAQGAVRILLEGDLRFDLDAVLGRAIELYRERLKSSSEETLGALRPFLLDRARYLLGREGFAYDEIEAAIAAGGSNYPDLRDRVVALSQIRETPGFLDVVLAAKRIANILRQAEIGDFRENALVEPAEKQLFSSSRELEADLNEAEQRGDYVAGFSRIAEFAEVLDQFFVEVLVMDEDVDLRGNRLALLDSIHTTLSRTAHLTEMVVDRAEQRKKA